MVFWLWHDAQALAKLAHAHGSPPSLIAFRWSTCVAGVTVPSGQYSQSGFAASFAARSRCQATVLYGQVAIGLRPLPVWRAWAFG